MTVTGWLRLQLALLGVVCCPLSGFGYDTPVHREVSERAAELSRRLGDVLTEDLGFPAGPATRFLGATPQSWIGKGAQFEDAPEKRVFNHFHDPLAKDWETAGLRVLFELGRSSVLWQQDSGQDNTENGPCPDAVKGGRWSWVDARERYWQALTHPSKKNREECFARTYRGLGHVMHLVQDASLPAHTRNDAHPYKVVFGQDLGNPDGYERWVDKVPPDELTPRLIAFVRPADSIFRTTGSAGAPAPVARLIDNDQYTGANPAVLADPVLGLAEYSNGNFFSDDTIFADRPALFGVIPHPARASVELLKDAEEAPGTGGQKRRYLAKLKDGVGEKVAHLAVPGALFDFLPRDLQDLNAALDRKVYDTYASFLLPRAVGYSAALLDHFFRGRLEVQPTGAQGSAIRVTNRTAGEALSGRLAVYYDMADGTRTPLASWPAEAAADGEVGPLVIPSPPADKPAAEPGRYLLVYRGHLGAEPDAVIGTWFTIWTAYAGTFSESASCVRQPSNQFACSTTASGGMRLVAPRADGTVNAEGSALFFQSYTVGGGMYPGDNSNFLYLNETGFAEAAFYLYRTGGGPRMRVTGSAPGCVLTWGSLEGEIEPALGGTPPEFEAVIDSILLDWVGDQPFRVGPGPLLFGFFAPGIFVAPPPGVGRTEGSSSCGVTSVQFLAD